MKKESRRNSNSYGKQETTGGERKETKKTEDERREEKTRGDIVITISCSFKHKMAGFTFVNGACQIDKARSLPRKPLHEQKAGGNKNTTSDGLQSS